MYVFTLFNKFQCHLYFDSGEGDLLIFLPRTIQSYDHNCLNILSFSRYMKVPYYGTFRYREIESIYYELCMEPSDIGKLKVFIMNFISSRPRNFGGEDIVTGLCQKSNNGLFPLVLIGCIFSFNLPHFIQMSSFC